MQDDDSALLRRYAAGNADAEPAFATLVHRHLNLVYSAALRQVGGDAHLAQDVAQSVFADLARKAATVARHPVLAGWLYSATHYAAAKAVRTEQRRRRREREAHALMHGLHDESAGDTAWERVRPTLDAALQELKARDRHALLLRFFEGLPFTTVGARLSLSENAARMCVERALERLRTRLERRGVRSTAVALGAALATHSVLAAPAGVAASVTSAVLASGAASASGMALALTFMTANKLPLALAGAVLIGGSGTLALQQRAQAALHEDIARLQAGDAELDRLSATNETLARDAAHVDALRRTAEELPQLRAEVETLRATARQAPSPPAAAPADRTARESGPGEPAYNLKELDQMPKVTSQKSPVFPDEYRSLGIPGSAKISFIVGADGRVQDAEATEANDEAFAHMAIEAVKQWTFEPGRKGGRAVATRMTVPIVFTVRHDDPDWF